MMRRGLSGLLILAGLVLMAWPVVTWAYGIYWQERLVRGFPLATSGENIPSPDVVDKAEPAPPEAASPSPKSPPAKQTKPQKPRKRPPRSGEALARLQIQRIRLKAVVLEGVDGVALRRGPGHLPETGLPGEDRNCAIAAHRDGWFRRLPEVRVGDPVWIETADGSYEYVVQEKRVVTPDRSDLLNRGPKPALTLITCTGPGYPRSTHRLLVFCDLRRARPR